MSVQARNLLLAVVYAGILAAAAVHFRSHIPVSEYHGDESGWIRAGFDVSRLLLDGDFNPLSWEQAPLKAWGNITPQLAKLPFAVVAMAMFPTRDPSLPLAPRMYSFSRTVEENKADGRVATGDVLHAMRHVGLFFGVLLLGACMLLLHWSAGPIAAVLGGCAIATMPQFVGLSSRAMTDTMYCFFILGAGVSGVWAAAAGHAASAWRRYLLCALCAAVATNVKLAGIILLLPFLVAVPVLLWRRGSIRAWMIPAMPAGALVVLAGISLATNPYLWPHVSRVSLSSLRAEASLVVTGKIPQSSDGNAPRWLGTIRPEGGKEMDKSLNDAELGKLRYLLRHNSVVAFPEKNIPHPREVTPAWYALSRPLQFPLLYLRWAELKQQLWSRPTWRQPATRDLVAHLLYSQGRTLLEPLLAVAGLCALLATVIRQRGEAASSSAAAILVFLLSVGVLVALTRLSDSTRYAMLIILFRTMLASMAVGWGVSYARGRVARAWADSREAG